MESSKKHRTTVLAAAVALSCGLAVSTATAQRGGGGRPGAESFGNNLSYPVIWAEGVPKVLRGTAGLDPVINGSWWWWWGTNAAGDPLSCAPDPDNNDYCDNGIPGSVTGLPGAGAIRVYLQKDEFNVWQAGTAIPAQNGTEPVAVDLIDWGDNLESVDWSIRSQVRVEVVLIDDLATVDPSPSWEPTALPMLEYGMRHVSGWGINEVHGLAAPGGVPEEGPGMTATIYSHCGRLLIQRLNVEREDGLVGGLIWTPNGWTEAPGELEDVINPPIYDGKVWQGGDGPGFYSAEINVKGKVIYGYTWNVRQNNEGIGDYRITFILDAGGTTPLNTYFVEGHTEVLEVVEEGESAESSEEGGGATGKIDFANNLTYMDVRIVGKSGGGGGGGKPNKSN